MEINKGDIVISECELKAILYDCINSIDTCDLTYEAFEQVLKFSKSITEELARYKVV